MLKGIIFDMDGVLVDSEEYMCKAAISMFKELGLEVKPDDFIPFVGSGENRYIGGVAEKYGFAVDIEKVKARAYAIYGEIVKGILQPLPGVHSFIKKTKESGLRLAIASSADQVKININLTEMGLSSSTFDAIVSGSDVELKKPHPDIFLAAAARIGLPPEECLVVEDAINGVEAAKAAGSKCLALTTSFTRNELNKADWIADNLASVPEETLDW